MTAHQLAKRLLAGPDWTVAVEVRPAGPENGFDLLGVEVVWGDADQVNDDKDRVIISAPENTEDEES